MPCFSQEKPTEIISYIKFFKIHELGSIHSIYAKNSLYFWIFLAFHLSCVSAQRPACVITMEHGESVSSCDIVTERVWWGLATHCSKANKQTRLVERKVCFISDAGNWGEGWNAWQKSVQRPTMPPKAPCPLATSGARAFIDGSGGGDYMHKQHSQL